MPEVIPVGKIKKSYDTATKIYGSEYPNGNPNKNYPSDPLVQQYMMKHDLNADDMDAAVKANRRFSEDPEDKQAIVVRNHLFSKISDKLPAESLSWASIGGGYREGKEFPQNLIPAVKGITARFLVNNTIANNPDLQAEYFRKKGFISRVVDGNVEIRKPDELGFRPIEKNGLDIFDTTDIIDDFLQGAAEGAATATKVAGVVGTPATGGASILPAMAAAGTIGGAFEAGRQAIGKVVGTRDEFDYPQILTESLGSAVMPGVTIGGAALLKGAAKGTTKLTGIMEQVKSSAEKIKQSAKDLGLDLLPGQISGSKLIQELTEAQYRGLGVVGPYAIKAKKVISDTYRKIDSELENLVGKRATVDSYETGQRALKAATNVIEGKRQAAKELYDAATEPNFYKNANVDTSGLKAELQHLRDLYQGEPNVQGVISKFENAADDVKNIRGLTNMKSALGDEIRVKAGNVSGMELKALGDMSKLVADAYDQTFEAFEQKAKSGEWKTSPEVIKAARAAKKEADKTWASMMDDLSTLVARPGKNVRGGPEAILDKFISQTPSEKFIDKILASNDIEKTLSVREKFPEAFETLRQGKLKQLYDRWAPSGEFDKKKAVMDLKKMPTQIQNIIFGVDSDKKIDALITIYDSIPKDINPSQTAKALQIFGGNIVGANVGSFVRGTLLNLSKTSQDLGQGLLLNLGNTLQGKKVLQAAGIGIRAGRGLLPQDKSPENNYMLIPEVGNQ